MLITNLHHRIGDLEMYSKKTEAIETLHHRIGDFEMVAVSHDIFCTVLALSKQTIMVHRKLENYYGAKK